MSDVKELSAADLAERLRIADDLYSVESVKFGRASRDLTISVDQRRQAHQDLAAAGCEAHAIYLEFRRRAIEWAQSEGFPQAAIKYVFRDVG